LTGFDLDKESTSSRKVGLGLGGYWFWSKGHGIHQLKNI